MVIQVYPKPRTCHLVKYQHLLSSCISGCFNHVTSLRMFYIQAVSTLLYLERRQMNTHSESYTRSQTDNSEIDEYIICKLTHTLTTIRSHYPYISCFFLPKNRLQSF